MRQHTDKILKAFKIFVNGVKRNEVLIGVTDDSKNVGINNRNLKVATFRAIVKDATGPPVRFVRSCDAHSPTPNRSGNPNA